MVLAISGRVSKGATTSCPRSPTGWKAGARSWRPSSARSRSSASGCTSSAQRVAEEAAINLVIERLAPAELDDLVRQAVASLPEPIVRRNPTLSNPFVRGKVYELACGEPMS